MYQEKKRMGRKKGGMVRGVVEGDIDSGTLLQTNHYLLSVQLSEGEYSTYLTGLSQDSKENYKKYTRSDQFFCFTR